MYIQQYAKKNETVKERKAHNEQKLGLLEAKKLQISKVNKLKNYDVWHNCIKKIAKARRT